MLNLGSARRLALIIVTTLSVAMTPCSLAQGTFGASSSGNSAQTIAGKVKDILSSFMSDDNDWDWNWGTGGVGSWNNASSSANANGIGNGNGNGNGNAYGHINGNGDPSNDGGTSSGTATAGGNTGTGSGGGTVGSVLNLLTGSDPEPDPDDPLPSPPSTPTSPTSPTTVTDDPFAGVTNPGNQGNQSPTGTISKTNVPYGSVPMIGDDADSVDYLSGKLFADARQAALDKGMSPEMSGRQKRAYESYARRLARTLSTMSREQQNLIFYGVR